MPARRGPHGRSLSFWLKGTKLQEMKLQLFVWMLVVLAQGSALAAEQRQQITTLNQEPIVLNKMTIGAFRQRSKAYDRRADNLWDNTEKLKTISYLDVIATAYAEAQFDLESVLLAKKAYRDRATKLGHDFFCNYAAIHIRVPIVFRSFVSPLGGSTTGPAEYISYSFAKKRLLIERIVDRTALMQASGISLAAYPSPQALERIKQIGASKKVFDFRKQVNFELQLQDLNRLYALYAGRPIMNPVDALEALCMLGERPKVAEVAEILQSHNYHVSPATLAAVIRTTKQREATLPKATDLVGANIATSLGQPGAFYDSSPINLRRSPFQAAGQLISGRREGKDYVSEGLQSYGKGRLKLLERILIEAPGHI